MPRDVGEHRLYEEAVHQRRLLTPKLLGPAIVAWWDANDPGSLILPNDSANPSGVANWIDKTGYDRNFAQSAISQRPTLDVGTFKGRNSIKFTKALAQFLSLSNFPASGLTGGLGVYFVARWQSIAGVSANDIQIIIENESRFIIQDRTDQANDPFQVAHLPTGGNGALGSVGAGDDAWKIFGGVMVKGSDTIFVNGTQRVSGTNIASFTTNANLRLGTGAALNRFFNGWMSEIIITSDLSAYMRQRIEGYLSWNNRLVDTLSPTNPFINRPPLIGD